MYNTLSVLFFTILVHSCEPSRRPCTIKASWRAFWESFGDYLGAFRIYDQAGWSGPGRWCSLHATASRVHGTSWKTGTRDGCFCSTRAERAAEQARGGDSTLTAASGERWTGRESWASRSSETQSQMSWHHPQSFGLQNRDLSSCRDNLCILPALPAWPCRCPNLAGRLRGLCLRSRAERAPRAHHEMKGPHRRTWPTMHKCLARFSPAGRRATGGQGLAPR